jgi:hydroxymethylpyrimidine/phosphomethylpyrimidine kinase
MRLARIAGYEVRGTGCMLASAIAAQRARGVPMLDAAWRAKAWLSQQIGQAVVIGGGRRVASG